MAKKEKELSEFVTIEWRKLAPMLIGLLGGVLVFVLFKYLLA